MNCGAFGVLELGGYLSGNNASPSIIIMLPSFLRYFFLTVVYDNFFFL